jgi:hypothetical protein
MTDFTFIINDGLDTGKTFVQIARQCGFEVDDGECVIVARRMWRAICFYAEYKRLFAQRNPEAREKECSIFTRSRPSSLLLHALAQTFLNHASFESFMNYLHRLAITDAT